MGEPNESKQVSRQVEVGDETYTVGKFKGYKALQIGRLLTKMGEIGPQISEKVNEFIAKYREQNVDELERATLEFRYPEEAATVSDEAWKESGGKIRLANDPTQAEILAVVFPTAFELAGDRIVDLLAWVIASDSDLREKDEEGESAVHSYIETLRKRLLHDATVDELFDLASAAQEVLKDQLAGKAEKARSLLALVGLDNSGSEEEETTSKEAETTEEGRQAASPVVEEDEETRSTPESQMTSERPDSSTDSPPPTDGDEPMSSTAPAGSASASTSG